MTNKKQTKPDTKGSQYNKAIVAVIGAIVTVLAAQGINVDPEITTSVTTLVTALVVYLVPNKEA